MILYNFYKNLSTMRPNKQLLILLSTVLVGGFMLAVMIVDNISSSSWSNKASMHLLNMTTNKISLARNLFAYTEQKDIAPLMNDSRTAILENDFETLGITKSTVGNSFSKRTSILRRRKREVENQNYAWHFKVNLSRFDDGSTGLQPSSNKVNDSDSQYLKPNLGVALHVEGRGPEDSYKEMHHAWDSVDGFLKRLFRASIEDLKKEGHNVVVDLTGLQNTSKKSDTTKEPKFKNTAEPRLSRDKEGKFLLGFLGFGGGNSENPPMETGSGELIEEITSTPTGNTHDFQSATSTLSSTESITSDPSVDLLERTTPSIMRNVTDQAIFLSTEFLADNLTNTEHIDPDQFLPINNSTEMQVPSTTTESIKDVSLTESTKLSSTMTSTTEFIKSIEKNLQFERSANQSADSQILPNIVSEAAISTDRPELKVETLPSISFNTNESHAGIPERPLATENVKEFCISLFSRMPKRLPKFSIEFSDSEGNGVILLEENVASSTSAPSPSQISKESSDNQSPESLGFIASVVRRNAGNRLDEEWVGGELLSSNSSPETRNDTRRFISLNMFPSFGSGRSAELDELENLETFNQNLNATSHILSVADCENFFRSIEVQSASSEPDASIPLINEEASLETEDYLHNEHTTTEILGGREKFNISDFGNGFTELPGDNTNVSFSNDSLVITGSERSFGWIFGVGNGNGIESTSVDDQILKGTSNQSISDESTTEYLPDETLFGENTTVWERITITKTNPQVKEILTTRAFNLVDDDLFAGSTQSNQNRFIFGFGSGDARESPEILEKDSGSEENFEHSTKNNQPKFFGSFFSGGSGDGSRILEESNSTSTSPPVVVERRGRRLDDSPDYFQEESLDFNRRRGRFENEPSLTQTTIRPNGFDDFTENTRSEATTSELFSVSTTIVSVLTSTMEHGLTNKSENRICSSDGACEKSLNERCIHSGDQAVCDCGNSFVRHPGSGKCETPVLIETSMKLPGEVFQEALKDETSELFQKKRKEAINMLYAFLGQDSKLLSNIAKVEVTFDEGSLIVNYKIMFAGESRENVSELVEQVDADIQVAMNDEKLLAGVPLNVTNADLSVSTVDQCATSDLNYCSEDADCILDEVKGFRCQCKEGFLDNSTDEKYAGEICAATCPPSYCGNNGFCDLEEDGERHCLCSGWYFGARCRINGIVLIGGFAGLNVLVVFIVVVAVCFCKKRRNHRTSGHYGDQPNPELGVSSAAVTDSIALGDVGPSKYVAMSTPMLIPAIKIIEPSLRGSVGIASDSSYDFDSTFDRTQSSGDANQSEKDLKSPTEAIKIMC